MKVLSNVRSVEIQQVICIRSLTGEGTDADPARIITEYYSMEGILIARIDRLEPKEGEL